ncbi:helix-turn-helix domain-containing protein [Paenarthrobacter sp. DKR-5]|uniref:IclR family transcriptional regulator n=1 Tax=Paenarthrobacter sp. DKR-5 TaxID=2835535 RepID=UPI001BDBE13B|nr:helix-turn-helix domain-containing protein [Paenarthrobacter sp. DKR-5]MBT1003163.1 helix-turn-helix domain-containing protein [Paenarthrobacter sp. DKR-5]
MSDTTAAAARPEQAGAAHSQTLSRGIRALEILAESPAPMTIAELSAALGVHRSIAYRILRTLEDHSLLMRDDAGRVQAGPGLAALARGVSRDLQAAALPELTEIANELSMTAFVAVWDQHDCVTLVTVEPRHRAATLVQRPGTRHSFSAGAPGIAIQSAMTEEQWQVQAPGQPYRAESRTARELGYAVSHDEVIAGTSAVAAPIVVPGQLPAALAVVYIRSDREVAAIGARLQAAARRIEAQLL